MNPHRSAAVAKRIVTQFRRDRRSLGLLFGAPIIVLMLVGALWGSTTLTKVHVIATGEVDQQHYAALQGTPLEVRALEDRKSVV